jgi:hypothetical protein
MQTARHYFITTLPALGELGSEPPMGLVDLIEHVSEHKHWRRQVEALVLLDDLFQRESLLADEIKEVEPAVLTVQQAQGEAPLPDFLVPDDQRDRSVMIEADRLWENYFRYAHDLGCSQGSRFLVQWVEFEVALRNALATTRARRLGLEEAGYLVATDLAAEVDEGLSPAVSEWETAPTPLAGLRAVLRARWAWIEQHDAWFSFSVDELLAYAARLMLLQQWRRSATEEEAAT